MPVPATTIAQIANIVTTAAMRRSVAMLLSTSARSVASGLRWLAWFGLGAVPIWVSWTPSAVPALAWSSLVYLVAVAALAGVGRTHFAHQNHRLLLITCWGLGALSLLASLLPPVMEAAR